MIGQLCEYFVEGALVQADLPEAPSLCYACGDDPFGDLLVAVEIQADLLLREEVGLRYARLPQQLFLSGRIIHVQEHAMRLEVIVESIHRIGKHDPAVVDHLDLLAQQLDLGQNMRGEDHHPVGRDLP